MQPRHRSRFLSIASISLLLAAAGGVASAQSWLGDAGLGIQARGAGGVLGGARVEMLYRGPGGESGGPGPRATNEQGQASFTGLAEGIWTLEVGHPDHLTFIATLSLRRGRKAEIVSSFLEASGAGRNPLRVKLFQPGTRSLGTPLAVAAPAAEAKPTEPVSSAVPAPEKDPGPSPDDTVPPPKTVEPAAPPPVEPAATAAEPQPVEPSGVEPAPTRPDPAPAAVPAAPSTVEEADAPEVEEPPVVEPLVVEPPIVELPIVEPPNVGPPAGKTPAATVDAPASPDPTPDPPATPPAEPAPPAEEPRAIVVEPALPPVAEPAPVTDGQVLPAEEPDLPALTPAPPAAAPAPPAPPVETSTPEPAAPIRPEPETAPVPAPAATLRGSDASARSFRDRTCFECKPGEWAIGASAEVPAGEGCSSGALDQAAAGVKVLAGRIAPALAGYGGSALVPAVLDRLDGDGRKALDDAIGGLLDPRSSCRLLALALPAQARMTGFRYEALEDGAGGDCLGDQPCPVGESRWLASPGIVRGEGATLLWAVFENRSTSRARLARFVGYFTPPTGWRP